MPLRPDLLAAITQLATMFAAAAIDSPMNNMSIPLMFIPQPMGRNKAVSSANSSGQAIAVLQADVNLVNIADTNCETHAVIPCQ